MCHPGGLWCHPGSMCHPGSHMCHPGSPMWHPDSLISHPGGLQCHPGSIMCHPWSFVICHSGHNKSWTLVEKLAWKPLFGLSWMAVAPCCSWFPNINLYWHITSQTYYRAAESRVANVHLASHSIRCNTVLLKNISWSAAALPFKSSSDSDTGRLLAELASAAPPGPRPRGRLITIGEWSPGMCFAMLSRCLSSKDSGKKDEIHKR